MAGNSFGQACSTPTCTHPAHTITTLGNAQFDCTETASGGCSTAIGDNSTASGNNSFSVGQYVSATAANAFTIGLGLSGNTLANSTAKSLFVGFDSNVPTFYVGAGSGSAGSFGNVGIATSVPGYRLDVNEGDINAITSTKGYRINGGYVLWHNNINGCIYVGGAGSSSNTGTNNTFIGYQAGKLNTAAADNTAVGYQALYTQSYNTDSTYNTAIGVRALYHTNHTGTGDEGKYNTGVGYHALKNNTSGRFNTAVGNQAMQNNTTGYWNTAFGHGALLSNNSGFYNTAAGLNALTANTSGTHNTAVGMNALDANTSGTNNVAIGVNAMDKSTTGTKNTAVGNDALFNAAAPGGDAANNNIALGYQAGLTITSGDNNTCVGYGADVSSATSSNRGAFGYNAVNNQGDNTIFLGNSTDNKIYVATGGSYNVQSDARFKFNVQENVMGLEFIKKLRPVTYQADAKKFDDFQIQNMPDSIKAMHQQGMDFASASTIRQSGFLAQEVDKAAKDCGFASTIVTVPIDSNVSGYTMNYAEIVVPLVKAVQEQQLMIDSLMQVVSQCCAAPQKRMGNTGDNSSGDNGTNQKENTINVELISIQKPVLYQNEPNPFDNTTTIRYYLPDNANTFYDEVGREIEHVELIDKGQGKIEALTINLAAGIYTYSMVINDKIIETRKMLRNK